MKKLKKTLIIGLTFILLLNIAGCSKNNDKEDNTTNTNNQEQQNDDTSNSLFNEVDCWSIFIDGEIYTFPMTYEEFIGKGWIVTDKRYEDYKMVGKSTSDNFNADHNQKDITVGLILRNFGNDDLDYRECHVVGINIEYTGSDMPKVEMPGGFVLNEQPTLEEIQKAFGKEDDYSGNRKFYAYDGQIYSRYWRFDFTVEGTLNGVEVLNIDK